MDEAPSEFSRSRRSYLYDTPKTGGSSKKIFIIVGIIILILGVVGVVFAMSNSGKNAEVVPTPTPTEEPIPTDTPSPTPEESGTPTPTKKVSLTPSPTKSTGTTSGLDRSLLSVAVQNGGGVPGAGSKMSDKLKDLGYNVTGASNADNFEYEKTVIQVKASKKEYLDQLKKDLGGSYTIGTASATLTGSSSDAIVIVGKK